LYILSKYAPDFIISEPSDDAILTICQDNCVNWDSFIQNVFNQTRLPTTLEDYCQAYVAIDKLAGADYKKDLKKWLQQFNIDLAYNFERNITLDKLNNDINNIIILMIDDKDFDYAIYVDELKNIVRIISILNEIHQLLVHSI